MSSESKVNRDESTKRSDSSQFGKKIGQSEGLGSSSGRSSGSSGLGSSSSDVSSSSSDRGSSSENSGRH
ncbi:MAG TPA: hypothetical protein VGJ82_21515 [Thermoanaerobaculia bacterium]